MAGIHLDSSAMFPEEKWIAAIAGKTAKNNLISVALIRITCNVLCAIFALSSITVLADVVVPATASFQLNGGSLALASSNLQTAGAFSLGFGNVTGAVKATLNKPSSPVAFMSDRTCI